MIKGQDLLVAFLLAEGAPLTLAKIADALGLSLGEAHKSVRRLEEAQLLRVGHRDVHVPHLIEFAVHGARFVFPPKIGRAARGIPTAQMAPPLNEIIVEPGPENQLVWKHAFGSARGPTLEPIYPSAPQAALDNPMLYRKLALLDGIRVGRVRTREAAKELLTKELRDGHA